MCINFRLCCTHFSCHRCKIRNVLYQLTQIYRRQRDHCMHMRQRKRNAYGGGWGWGWEKYTWGRGWKRKKCVHEQEREKEKKNVYMKERRENNVYMKERRENNVSMKERREKMCTWGRERKIFSKSFKCVSEVNALRWFGLYEYILIKVIYFFFNFFVFKFKKMSLMDESVELR